VKAAIFIFSALTFLCHYPASSAAQEADRKPTRTPSFTKEGSETCLRCHSGEKMRAISASPHGDKEINGTPATAHGCETCHGPGSIHVSRAHGGRGFPSLTEFGRGSRGSPRDEKLHACLSCHADEKLGEMQTLFIGSAHDRPSINCSNCHNLHAETDPMSDKEAQTKACSRCHRRDIRDHPRFKEKSIDFDALSCSACHDVHAPAKLKE